MEFSLTEKNIRIYDVKIAKSVNATFPKEERVDYVLEVDEEIIFYFEIGNNQYYISIYKIGNITFYQPTIYHRNGKLDQCPLCQKVDWECSFLNKYAKELIDFIRTKSNYRIKILQLITDEVVHFMDAIEILNRE